MGFLENVYREGFFVVPSGGWPMQEFRRKYVYEETLGRKLGLFRVSCRKGEPGPRNSSGAPLRNFYREWQPAPMFFCEIHLWKGRGAVSLGGSLTGMGATRPKGFWGDSAAGAVYLRGRGFFGRFRSVRRFVGGFCKLVVGQR